MNPSNDPIQPETSIVTETKLLPGLDNKEVSPPSGQIAESASLQTDTSIKRHKQKRLILAGLVLCVAIVATALVVVTHRPHHYSSLSEVTIGATQGEKTTFSYPSIMTTVNNTGDSATYADIAPQTNNHKMVYSELSVTSDAVGRLTPQAVTVTKNIMKNKQTGYQEIIGSYAAQTSAEATNLSFGPFTDFSNSHIKNGLQADFTYKSKIGDQTGKGRLVLTFGNERLYGMVIQAQQTIWNNNDTIWNKITNSLAIDQP